jgi:hypothetical protein
MVAKKAKKVKKRQQTKMPLLSGERRGIFVTN